MNLVHNWKDILKRAWSVRIALAIAAMEGLYLIWPYFNESVSLGTLASVQIGLSVALVLARLVDQGMADEKSA